MYYQLSRTGASEIKKHHINSSFGGSSAFRFFNGKFIKKTPIQKNIVDLENETNFISTEPDEKTTKMYRLKKSKIRNKILNFFSLNASRKFCAFYSISFPMNLYC